MLLPIAVLLGVALFALRWKEASAASRSHLQQLQPPVVIVAGGQVAPYQAAQSLPTSLPADWQQASGARQYTIIGED